MFRQNKNFLLFHFPLCKHRLTKRAKNCFEKKFWTVNKEWQTIVFVVRCSAITKCLAFNLLTLPRIKDNINCLMLSSFWAPLMGHEMEALLTSFYYNNSCETFLLVATLFCFTFSSPRRMDFFETFVFTCGHCALLAILFHLKPWMRLNEFLCNFKWCILIQMTVWSRKAHKYSNVSSLSSASWLSALSPSGHRSYSHTMWPR